MNVSVVPLASERQRPHTQPPSHGPTRHCPGAPVLDGSTYAAVAADGRTLNMQYLPPGAAFPFSREPGVHYVRVGLAQAISH